MRTQIFILLYGVVVTAYGYPVYDYDDYEGYNLADYADEPIYQQNHRVPRSLEGVIKKTSRGAINMARQFIRTFLPSAAQIGYQGVRRMVKRSTPFSPAVPATASLLPMSNTFYNYNYQYPGMGMAAYYNYPGYPYSGYQYPYAMSPQYGADKRNYMPYSYANSYYPAVQQKYYPAVQQKSGVQQPYGYRYPAAMATYTAIKQTVANPAEKPKANKETEKHSSIIPDTSTANGISQGLIDLENDVNGFNQAIQYMKEAFIEDNNDGSSDLEEKIHEDKSDVMGVKKDLIKKKKTSAELLDAFKRTLDSKEKLENKLVNYFTNYVCGDDC